MKSRVPVALLLSLLGLMGVMQGTASAKGGTVGVITVNRTMTLNITNLSPDTSRYFGTVSHPPATVDIVAKARIRKKQGQASARRQRGRIKKAPPQKQEKAKAAVQEFCFQFTRSVGGTVDIIHRPPPPDQAFRIGFGVPNLFFEYSVTGVRAPRNDVIAARTFGAGVAQGNTVVQTGPWEWKGNCGPAVEVLTLMP